MKAHFPYLGLARLCGWFGVTRQAYYQNAWKAIDTTIEEGLVLQEIVLIRKNHQRMGTRKLYEKLQPFLLGHGIKMGRDGLFTLLANHNLLVRKRKKTDTHHPILPLDEKIPQPDKRLRTNPS